MKTIILYYFGGKPYATQNQYEDKCLCRDVYSYRGDIYSVHPFT